MRETISTDQAPKAIGPYSQAVKSGGFIFCSGQIALNPETQEFENGSVADQTHRVLKNLKAVLVSAESSLDQIVKTTIYLTDMADFQAVNTVYAEYFGKSLPARATVAVKELPKEAKVEIEAIATAS